MKKICLVATIIALCLTSAAEARGYHYTHFRGGRSYTHSYSYHPRSPRGCSFTNTCLYRHYGAGISVSSHSSSTFQHSVTNSIGHTLTHSVVRSVGTQIGHNMFSNKSGASESAYDQNLYTPAASKSDPETAHCND